MLLKSEKLSALVGVRHAFSTRLGGVSAGPYGTLNLGRGVGDEIEAVEENLRLFALLAGFENPVRQSSQVHGIALVDAMAQPSAEELRSFEADGLWTTQKTMAVGVRTADCAPLLFAARTEHGEVGAVSAVHAGWRGATAGIAGEMVRHFAGLAFPASALVVAIGPTIGPEAFEVGPEVIEAASASIGGRPAPMLHGANGRPHLDLRALLELQLLALGVSEEHIEWVGGCTATNEAMFYSHRRDRVLTGRHLSAIAFGHVP